MAYQTRQRDPLLDSNMQAALERRGKEILGIALTCAGLAIGLMLISYSPEDPNWMAATDAVPQNYLGRFGASFSAILMMIVGYGAYLLALGGVVWGLRFTFHQGSERALSRAIFLPIAVALASIYCVSIVPGDGWTHSFGLGGLFGDTVMGALVNILPFSASAGLKMLAALSFFAMIAFSLFVLGANRSELRSGTRFLLVGMITTVAAIAALFGQAGRGAGTAAMNLRDRQANRRDARQTAPQYDMHGEGLYYEQDPYAYAQPMPQEAPLMAPAGGLFDKVPLLRAFASSDADYGAEPDYHQATAAPETDDRMRNKISEVVRNRVRREPTAVETAVAARRGPQPLAAPATRVEPPLSAGLAPRVQPTAQYQTPETAPQPSAVEDNMFLDEFADDYPMDDTFAATPVPAAPAPVLTRSQPPASEPRKVVQHMPRKQVAPSRHAMADAQPSLPLEAKASEYEFPPLNLLTSAMGIERHHLSDEALEENARMLENVLDDYGVKGEIVSVRPGPVVTMYELEPAPGLKASRVIGLADDIARSMSALSARVSTVPGRSVIGIELPNVHREKVVLREILSSRDFGDGNQRLPLALGKDIGGEPVVANLAKMPHLLIAGTTGSGKSVAINTMILSLLYKLKPEECRMIMIDPKMLELSVYDGIPHLLSPVVTDPKKAVVALKWVVGEMEERYRKMSKMGVRNIDGYNGRVRDALAKNEMFKRTVQTGFDDITGEPVFETEEFQPEIMPFIVVVVDEMADLMMVAGKEIEACIQRLAQMARASGIHLIMATQRPSVDVITGTIKANFPTRISFHVTSKIDSRTILGEMGAEQLLGMGDMLYMAGGAKITRVHGPFVSDEEVEEIVRHLKSFGPPSYAASVLDGPDEDKESDIDLVLGLGGNTDGEDALYDQAVQIVIKDRKCSTSYIQRKLAIGYNKAARLVEQMEDSGLVSAANHVGKREILVPEQG